MNNWLLGIESEKRIVLASVAQTVQLPVADQAQNRVGVGDDVFVWRSIPGAGGVIAQGTVVQVLPRMLDVLLVKKCITAKEYIKQEWLAVDPVLRPVARYSIMSTHIAQLDLAQAARLAALVRNTGREWTREECLVGLLAYTRTKNGSVSMRAGFPVADAALLIGRAVTGMYNRVMNYRALDPNDSRSGLKAGGEVATAVWMEFYDGATNSIRVDELEAQVEAYWGSDQRPVYHDFGEAPNDDPSDLKLFALRVRRGQPKFRENLLKAYEHRCCISLHGPPAVLEAAHIVSHASTGINELDNGLLLRSDIHSLFDQNLIKVHPQSLDVVLHDSIRESPYGVYNGRSIAPRSDGKGPSVDYLTRRWEEAVHKLD